MVILDHWEEIHIIWKGQTNNVSDGSRDMFIEISDNDCHLNLPSEQQSVSPEVANNNKSSLPQTRSGRIIRPRQILDL